MRYSLRLARLSAGVGETSAHQIVRPTVKGNSPDAAAALVFGLAKAVKVESVNVNMMLISYAYCAVALGCAGAQPHLLAGSI